MKPPEKLPSTGVTKVTFKVFLNQLTAFLEQDPLNYVFLKGGRYSTWSAKQLGRRILALAGDDPEHLKLIKDNTEKKDDAKFETECKKLLDIRESQCARFVQLIAVLCFYTEQDDIDQCSTSWGWIVMYLEKHYNLESRGAHFLDIASLTFKKGTPHQTFYKQFRAGFMDNLRKKGDKLEYKNDEELTADEKMSPTLESSIVLWALERIDPRLALKVQKLYGHQMVANKCLVTLQPTIFQNIPAMLQELDEAEPRSSSNSLSGEGESQLNGSWTGGSGNFRGGNSRGGNFRGGNSRGGRPPFQSNRGMGRGTSGRGSGGSRKKFCRICYHAGSPEFVFQSHTISECTKLSSADKSDLRSVLGAGEVTEWPEEYELRNEVFEAPGWDIEENSCVDKEINTHESYTCSCSLTLPVQLNTISPIASQILNTKHHDKSLPITLDSGATVSFVRLRDVIGWGIKIWPNGQLATLADEETRMASKGEIDVEVETNGIVLRLRALVMEKLQAAIFGGTNFHKDNRIRADISEGTITLHNQYTIRQSNDYTEVVSYPPSRLRTDESKLHQVMLEQEASVESKEVVIRTKTVNIPHRQTALPGEPILIPLPESCAKLSRIAILPSFQQIRVSEWPAQVCSVQEGNAVYLNTSTRVPISHPKHAHFKTLPVLESVTAMAAKPSRAPVIQQCPVQVEKMLAEIKVNEDMLSRSQLAKLREIHVRNKDAFDGDLSRGYNHERGKYVASFGFKENSKPPPLKVWTPQYNRACLELLQAKCDQLETQGVLADPASLGINVKHVSPTLIQQKGRAKHKELKDCTLDEIRFISCQNVLNDSIRPVPSSSTSHIKIFKFLGRWKFHIFADMQNSYFQIPVERRLWGYLAINTPYRGMRVMTRAGQGLLNSDVHLDQLLMKVLGDELKEGIVEVARDDIQVGGNTIDEVLWNWDKVLSKLNKCNLKIAPNKVRVLLDDTEVYGYRIKKGYVLPSPHIVSNLGDIKLEDLKTVKQTNSWRGLYKTLIAHLPHLAFYMNPFDKATAGRNSRDNMVWTPELRAAFNNATAHLANINKTFLPHPEDRLILKPDTAKVKICTGWALYAMREEADGMKLLPVQYCSAKLPDYMANWYPCELECTGAVLSIDQVAHWINESKNPTTVMPDSMPVVKAANLMKAGRHSKNPRLQSLLACVNRRNVVFVHSSARTGQHIVPDTLSRLGRNCDCKDCGVKRFLEEIPSKVELMAMEVPADISSTVWTDLEPCQIATMTSELNDMLVNNLGAIPFGNKKAWGDIQRSDSDCRAVHSLKRAGNLPIKKRTNRNINRLLRECTVSEDGLLVVNKFDTRTMRHMDRIVVPQKFLQSILALLHIRLLHPKTYQLQSIFEKYFFSFGVMEACKELKQSCDICLGLERLPKEMEEFHPRLSPSHPGSHMNVDVLRRAGQKIVVNTDQFSGYTTACFTDSEKRDDLEEAIIKVVTPIRHSAAVSVRVDQASAFQSLVKSKSDMLESNGIRLDMAEDFNKNSNCTVDKKIQELEEEFKRLAPEGEKISVGQMAQAITMLNSRVRNQGLTAAEIHFSRDPVRGENLNLDDKQIMEEKVGKRAANHEHSAKSKAGGGGPCTKPDCKPGDIVFVKRHGSKHEARSPFLVTGEGDRDGEVSVRKVLHSHTNQTKAPVFSSERKSVDLKFLVKRERETRLDDKLEMYEENEQDDDWYGRDRYEEVYGDEEEWYEESDDNREAVDDNSEEGMFNDECPPEWDPTPKYDDEDYEMAAMSYGLLVRKCDDDESETEPDNDDDEPVDSDESQIEEGALLLDQSRPPVKGDRILLYDDQRESWILVNLTSEKIKYYRATGPYYNFRGTDGTTGGQYLHQRGFWSHVTPEQEVALDLNNIIPYLPVVDEVVQYDGGVTPDSLTTDDDSKNPEDENLDDGQRVEDEHAVLSPREIRQRKRWMSKEQDDQVEMVGVATDGEFLDDGYTDQESVFGSYGEPDVEYRRLFDKFGRGHENFQSLSEEERGARLHRISQTLDLDVTENAAMIVQVEQVVDYPSAASFPRDDVNVPGYHYHLARGRTLSLSSPDVCDDRDSLPAWRIWYSRLWSWGKEFRRR